MKRCKFILIAFFCILLSVNETSAQRYLPGQTGIQVTGGIADGDYKLANYHAGIAFSKYTKSGNRWLYGAEFLNTCSSYNSIQIPVNQFTGELGYYINLLSDRRKNFFFSLGISALSGYETVNWGDKKLMDGALITNKDQFIYGGAISFEIESYLTDRIALLLNVRERILWGSDVELLHNQIGLGIKYILK